VGSPLFTIPFADPAGGFTDMGGDTGVPAPPNFLTSGWHAFSSWFTGKNADTTGMSPKTAAAAQAAKSLSNIGLLTSVLGGVNSAIGTFYAAKTAQYQEKSEASSYAFQSDMAAINSSRAEITAESIEEAGKTQVANYTMSAGQQKASATASMAARGIALGVGSAAEVSASMDIEKDLNVLAINSNTTRQTWAAREQGTNYANEALLDRTSAVNAYRSANSISPAGNTVNSLLGSATQIAGQWDYNRWLRMRLASGQPVPQIGIGS
jgi:hypothetical protein